MSKRFLATLQFSSSENYEENLHTLISLIQETPERSLVLAPEVCLTGFDYAHFEEAAQFSHHAINKLLELSETRIIVLSLIQKHDDGKFYNMAKVLHKKKTVHEQAKYALFPMGEETKYFSPSKDEKPLLFEVDNLKLGILICFEMRFKQYWQDLEGADVILVPARWGKLRSENFKVLSEALAVINQCYVLAADACNEDCTGMSAIVTPFGKVSRNGNALCLINEYDKQEIRRMRRYLDVGIK